MLWRWCRSTCAHSEPATSHNTLAQPDDSANRAAIAVNGTTVAANAAPKATRAYAVPCTTWSGSRTFPHKDLRFRAARLPLEFSTVRGSASRRVTPTTRPCATERAKALFRPLLAVATGQAASARRQRAHAVQECTPRSSFATLDDPSQELRRVARPFRGLRNGRDAQLRRDKPRASPPPGSGSRTRQSRPAVPADRQIRAIPTTGGG